MKVTLAIDGDGDDEDCDNASEDGGDNEVNDEGEGNNGWQGWMKRGGTPNQEQQGPLDQPN